MKKLILLLLFIPLLGFGQNLEKEKLQSVVKTFFEGFHNKDSLVIASVKLTRISPNFSWFKLKGLIRLRRSPSIVLKESWLDSS